MPDLEILLQLTEEAAGALSDVIVVDARWCHPGGKRVLEITIHRPGGRISLDDCETVSRQLEKLLDEHDPPVIDGAYVLEVQSPGLERELKTEREFAAFIGETVEVGTRRPHELLGWSFVGRLNAKDGNTITIAGPQRLRASGKGGRRRKPSGVQEAETVTLDMEMIAKVKLYTRF